MKLEIEELIPLRDNMLVKRIKQDSGGVIELPTNHNQRMEFVEVIKCGADVTEFEEGDVLIKSSWSGTELDFISLGKEWDDYRLIAPGQVVAKIAK